MNAERVTSGLTEAERQEFDRLYAFATKATDAVERASLFGRAGCIKREALRRERGRLIDERDHVKT